MTVVIVVIFAVLVVATVIYLVRRREPDTYGSFQRQIDALSPEARRPVVEQVNQAADEPTPTDSPAEPSADASESDEPDEPTDHPHGS